MHRFRFNPADVSDDNVVVLSKEESRHALRVLRLKPGSVVELLDGKDKKFRGVVVSESAGLVSVSIDQNPVSNQTNVPEIILAQAVIKPERMELLIQKACELGVAKIVPILAERSVVKLSRERWHDKLARWNKIALESCKQCGRARVPEVLVPVRFAEFAKTVSPKDLFLFPTLAVAGKPLQSVLRKGSQKVVLAIGPEGDFTPEETQAAITHGAVPVSLGEAVLRSETAALYLISVAFFMGSESA